MKNLILSILISLTLLFIISGCEGNSSPGGFSDSNNGAISTNVNNSEDSASINIEVNFPDSSNETSPTVISTEKSGHIKYLPPETTRVIVKVFENETGNQVTTCDPVELELTIQNNHGSVYKIPIKELKLKAYAYNESQLLEEAETVITVKPGDNNAYILFGQTDKILFVAFKFDQPAAQSICMMDEDGTNIMTLYQEGTSLNGLDNPAFSPSADKILFDKYPEGKIYRMDSDGQNLSPFIVPKSGANICVEADYRADSKAIVFKGGGDIYIADENGSYGDFPVIYGSGEKRSPKFSPDGTKIAFYNVKNGSYGDICIANSDGTDIRTIYQDAGVFQGGQALETKLDYSPTGDKIVFSNCREIPSPLGGAAYICDIYSVNTDGTDPKALIEGNVHFDESGDIDLMNSYHDPDYRPDGEKIAFVRIHQETPYGVDWNIYVMDKDGSSPYRLSNAPEFTYFFSPCWGNR